MLLVTLLLSSFLPMSFFQRAKSLLTCHTLVCELHKHPVLARKLLQMNIAPVKNLSGENSNYCSNKELELLLRREKGGSRFYITPRKRRSTRGCSPASGSSVEIPAPQMLKSLFHRNLSPRLKAKLSTRNCLFCTVAYGSMS